MIGVSCSIRFCPISCWMFHEFPLKSKFRMKVECFMRVIQRSATDMADAKRPPWVINFIIKNQFNQKKHQKNISENSPLFADLVKSSKKRKEIKKNII